MSCCWCDRSPMSRHQSPFGELETGAGPRLASRAARVELPLPRGCGITIPEPEGVVGFPVVALFFTFAGGFFAGGMLSSFPHQLLLTLTTLCSTTSWCPGPRSEGWETETEKKGEPVMTGEPPDTGGVDIGTWGQVGGSIAGFDPATKFATRTPEWQELRRQYQAQAGKDYNDQPFAPTVGSDNGQRLVDSGLTDL
jgi:hypothetical protein